MKRKTLIKTAIGIIAIGIISAGLIYRFVINKSHPDYEKARPAYIISAPDLFESFRSDRKGAEAKFNGKVILLNGRLDKIETSDLMVMGVFVFDQGMFGDEGIRCTMLPHHSESLKTWQVGTEIKLKGFLTGYNDTDVILENCSLVR